MDGYEYGNLLRIMTDLAKANSNGSFGEFGWDGLPGNYFMVDPEEDLILVFLQHVAEGPDRILRNKYRQIVYSSLED
jgi:CubicO group peptidase (beta-lactamase class C family)